MAEQKQPITKGKARVTIMTFKDENPPNFEMDIMMKKSSALKVMAYALQLEAYDSTQRQRAEAELDKVIKNGGKKS